MKAARQRPRLLRPGAEGRGFKEGGGSQAASNDLDRGGETPGGLGEGELCWVIGGGGPAAGVLREGGGRC